MKNRFPGARTRTASGRFLWVWGFALLVASCQTVDTPGAGPPEPTAAPTVVLEEGSVTPAEARAADSLMAAATRSAEARRFFEVVRITDEIVGEYPASRVAGDALRLNARALVEVGEFQRADDAAARYLSLLPEGDPRRTEMRILRARAAENDPRLRLEQLLSIDDAATPEEVAEATPLAREAADALPPDTLRAVVDQASRGGPIAPVVDARLAVSLLEVGRGAEGSVYAERAVSNGASGVDLTWAQGVLEGTLPEGRERVTDFTIAVVLPTGGPPALAEYAQEIAEGIEVAVATVLDSTFAVSVVTRDDEGDPLRSAEVVSELEAEGVVGIVGFLQDESLASAGGARGATVPLVSPTARNAANAGEAVYSLEGADIQGARMVARYGASRAYQRIAMLYPNTPTAQAEAEAFREQAEALGMPVVGSFTYEAGATFFENQILGARDALRGEELAALAMAREDTLYQDTLRMEVLEPTALFMPIPPEDVEFLAPQVIHFGLDTLAVEILGTTGWTDPQTVAVVEPRLTDGVVATAAVDADDASPGASRFRDAYEARYQRTLVGSTAATGYDAALLLLEALRPGRVDPDQLEASFEALADVQGATGLFSVVDGRVVRRTRLVRIENRTPIPLEIR